jgi:hypothetical protein
VCSHPPRPAQPKISPVPHPARRAVRRAVRPRRELSLHRPPWRVHLSKVYSSVPDPPRLLKPPNPAKPRLHRQRNPSPRSLHRILQPSLPSRSRLPTRLVTLSPPHQPFLPRPSSPPTQMARFSPSPRSFTTLLLAPTRAAVELVARRFSRTLALWRELSSPSVLCALPGSWRLSSSC